MATKTQKTHRNKQTFIKGKMGVPPWNGHTVVYAKYTQRYFQQEEMPQTTQMHLDEHFYYCTYEKMQYTVL